MITTKNNFLDETFINNFIQNIIKKSQEYKPIWKSNINWGENIVKDSSLVLAYEINKEHLNYIKSRERMSAQRDEIDNIKAELQEIKSLLKQIIN